jgi:hypothetical protein
MADPWLKFDEPPPDEDLLLEPLPPAEQIEADRRTLQGKDPRPHGLTRLTSDQLKAFVLGVCDGSIFTSNQIRQSSEVGMVFMPLILGGLSDWDKDSLEKIGIIYEHMSESLPRSINGMPIFASCNIMHIDDWKIAERAIHYEIERRKNIKLDLQPEAEEK